MSYFTELLILLNFIYPLRCSCCNSLLPKSSLKNICDTCKNELLRNSLRDTECSVSIIIDSFRELRVWSVLKYNNTLSCALKDYKYNNNRSLGKDFSLLMRDFITEHIPIERFDIVATVPVTAGSYYKKTYNHAEGLSKQMAGFFGKKHLKDALLKTRSTKRQSTLEKSKRVKNLKEAFSANTKRDLTGKTILIIDDVMTTGTTLTECAKALHKAGAAKVSAFTLARGN